MRENIFPYVGATNAADLFFSSRMLVLRECITFRTTVPLCDIKIEIRTRSFFSDIEDIAGWLVINSSEGLFLMWKRKNDFNTTMHFKICTCFYFRENVLSVELSLYGRY